MNKPKYIILRGIDRGNRFFTLNNDPEPTKLATGEVAYDIIGYGETMAECQFKLFGYVSTDSKD